MARVNPVRIQGATAYIGLLGRRGAIVAEAIVNVSDIDRVLAVGLWTRVTVGRPGMCYARCYQAGVQLHRFLLDAPVGLLVDHINHNGLDCRMQNLRLATADQNMQNRRGASSHSQSGVRGVYWDERTLKWRVQVTAFGKVHRIGRFVQLDDAALAAREARMRLMTHTLN